MDKFPILTNISPVEEAMVIIFLFSLKIIVFIHHSFPFKISGIIVAIAYELTLICNKEEINFQTVLEALMINEKALPSMLALVFMDRFFAHRGEIRFLIRIREL
jgi:hypothetical protein